MTTYTFPDGVIIRAGDRILLDRRLGSVTVDIRFDAKETLDVVDGQLTRNAGTLYLTTATASPDATWSIGEAPTNDLLTLPTTKATELLAPERNRGA